MQSRKKFVFIIMHFRVVSRTKFHHVLLMNSVTTRAVVNHLKKTINVPERVTGMKKLCTTWITNSVCL